jgi:Ca-activated chloride channel homolog
MKFRVVSLLGFAAFAAASFTAVLARQQQSAPSPSAGPIRAEVTRVNMLFTVTDKHGRFVTDLGKDDFEVFENKKPQSILEFTSETDLPLRLGILIDTSNSIRDRFRFQQEAATNFVNSVVREQDKATVVRARHRSDQRHK